MLPSHHFGSAPRPLLSPNAAGRLPLVPGASSSRDTPPRAVAEGWNFQLPLYAPRPPPPDAGLPLVPGALPRDTPRAVAEGGLSPKDPNGSRPSAINNQIRHFFSESRPVVELLILFWVTEIILRICLFVCSFFSSFFSSSVCAAAFFLFSFFFALLMSFASCRRLIISFLCARKLTVIYNC